MYDVSLSRIIHYVTPNDTTRSYQSFLNQRSMKQGLNASKELSTKTKGTEDKSKGIKVKTSIRKTRDQFYESELGLTPMDYLQKRKRRQTDELVPIVTHGTV